MNVAWARASELDRVLTCPGSLLPLEALARFDPPSDKRDEAAAWGTLAHHWKAAGLVVPVAGYPRHPRALKNRLSSLTPTSSPSALREELWPSGGEHEVGVAVSALYASVGSIQGPPAAVDAWKALQPDDRVTGTLDYHGLLLDEPWVDDLKTGRVAPSPRSAQLWLYGLATFRLHLGSPDRIITSITHWPRYPATAAPKRIWGSISRDELLRFERVLKLKYERLLELRSQALRSPTDFDYKTLRPSEDRCRFCPSRVTCPVATEPKPYSWSSQ